MSEPQRVTVVGAGSWGTTLALLLSQKGHDVHLWALEPDVVESIRTDRINHAFLPDVELPPSLEVTGDLSEAVDGCQFLISVVPSQFVSKTLEPVAGAIPGNAIVVNASKGIEISTLRRMEEVFDALLPTRQMEGYCALSGPSFAVEVARESPTAVAVASASETSRARVQQLFQTDYFRVYTNPDVVGVELGGALKNVIAVAAGVVSGLGFGHNTLAALITRGLAEIRRLGQSMGARPPTFAGLAGMGDLVLTCTGDLSRNRTVGYRLGQGEELESILGSMRSVAEGVKTVEAVRQLATRTGVEMPIAEEVHAILYEGRSAADAVRALMMRDPKPEEWG